MLSNLSSSSRDLHQILNRSPLSTNPTIGLYKRVESWQQSKKRNEVKTQTHLQHIVLSHVIQIESAIDRNSHIRRGFEVCSILNSKGNVYRSSATKIFYTEWRQMSETSYLRRHTVDLYASAGRDNGRTDVR